MAFRAGPPRRAVVAAGRPVRDVTAITEVEKPRHGEVKQQS